MACINKETDKLYLILHVQISKMNKKAIKT